MDPLFIPIVVIPSIFVVFPWIIFHYITKWKTAKTLTGEDEKLLDDLYEMARRLDDRLCTIERIMNAENPNWRQTCLPDSTTSIPDSYSRTRTRSGERA
jgi:phage shock protein B